MRLHPRTMLVQQARVELGRMLLDLEERYGLTPAETVSALSEQLSRVARYAIRAERHPDDPDRGGDEE